MTSDSMRVLDGPRLPGYSLVLNLRAAKALGLTIPPSVLLRATEVIKDQ